MTYKGKGLHFEISCFVFISNTLHEAMLLCISIGVLPHCGGEGKHCYYAVLFVFYHTVEGFDEKNCYTSGPSCSKAD